MGSVVGVVAVAVVVVGAAAAVGVPSFLFASGQALEAIDCSLLEEVYSILLVVGASVAVGLVDNVLLFLPREGSLVSFLFGSGDNNVSLLGGRMV